MQKLWGFCQRYVKADTRDEAAAVLSDALDHLPHDDFIKMAKRFGEDYGRLPDHLHAAVILTGGDVAKQYLEYLAGKTEERKV